MVSPGRKALPAGAVVVRNNSAKGPVSRILSCAVIPLGAALPRTLISDLPGGFGVLRTAAPCRVRYPWIFQSSLAAPGRRRARILLRRRVSLPIWSCSVWGLPCPGLYRTGGALLPHHFTLTPALELSQRRTVPASRANSGIASPGWPSSLAPKETGRGVAEAVSFLWHWPSMSLYAHVPDVIRHTALRSSDFPPPAEPVSQPTGSDRPVLLPVLSLSHFRTCRMSNPQRSVILSAAHRGPQRQLFVAGGERSRRTCGCSETLKGHGFKACPERSRRVPKIAAKRSRASAPDVSPSRREQGPLGS